MEDNKELKTSTENKRQKKAERRDTKAARKEANRVEEKKSRPNNVILALMIFGVVVVMFAFAGGYNYFSKPASIEKYMEDNGIMEMYNNAPISEYTKIKLGAEDNTLKIWLTIDEDAPKEEVEQYKGEDGKENLTDMGAYFLTSIKPQTRGFGATAKIKVKQGDETVNYLKMSYRDAKKYVKEIEKKAEEAADTEAETGDTEEETETDGE